MLKTKDQAAPSVLASEDVAKVHQPAGDEELEDDHNTELDGHLDSRDLYSRDLDLTDLD